MTPQTQQMKQGGDPETGDSLMDDSVQIDGQSHQVKPGRVGTFSPRFEDESRRFTVSSGQNNRLKQLRSPNRPNSKQQTKGQK